MSGFGLDNLPYGVVAAPGGEPRCAVDLLRAGDADLIALATVEARLPVAVGD